MDHTTLIHGFRCGPMVVPPGGADFGMGPGVPTFWQSPRECPQGTLTASRGSSQLSTQMPGALCMYLRGQLTPSLDPLTLVSLRPRDTHCSSSSRTRGGRQNGGGGTRTETQPALSLLVVEARPAGSLGPRAPLTPWSGSGKQF